MNYIDYERQTTRKGELMNGFKPLIDVNAPRRSNMVMIARWFAVVACASGVAALLEAASRLGWLQ